MLAGIIAANNIRYSPYIFFYTDILKRHDIRYELIIADRYGLDEDFDAPVMKLPWNPQRHVIANCLEYSRGVKKILRKKKYDLLIVLTSSNAVFLSPWLKRHYEKRYIVDIRDYSHENIPLYFSLEKAAVMHSLLNVVSSGKFTSFLPEADYHVCHNYEERTGETFSFRKGEDPVRIGYVGGLSYVEQNEKLMRMVRDDPRFTLDYYGTSTKEQLLREAAKPYENERIRFHGGYAPAEKEEILWKVDILFNAYGNHSPLLDYALSNKLYDALIHRKPILTCPDTYMTEMAGPLAFAIDLDDGNALNDLYEWYQAIDGETVEAYASAKMDAIREENRETREKIDTSIRKLKETASAR